MSRYADGPPLLPDRRPRFDPAIARRMADDLAAGHPRMDLWAMWEAIECPTLLLRGETSTVLPTALAREMLARQSQCSLTTIPNCGHQILFHEPALLAKTIATFARSLDP
jgi:pimeloyl-ACP methyl ester carboxylesterase